MSKHKKKIKQEIINLVTLAVESIGQKNLQQTDLDTMKNILFNERNRDRAILRLAQIEDNYKCNEVFRRIEIN